MSVPQYSDLGKTARDVFRTGYAYDSAKVRQVIPKKPYGFEFGGSLDLKSFKGGGSFMAQYDTEGYGELSAKVEANGPFVGEYKLKRTISDSVDLNFGCSYNPTDAALTCRAGGAFYNAILHATGSLTKDYERRPDLFATGVIKLPRSLFLGYQVGYSTSNSQVTKNDLALAYEDGELGAHLRCIQISKEFGFSAFYKVNEKTDVAMDCKVGVQEEARPWFAGAGIGHKLDDKCKLRLKLDKNLQFGTSVQLNLQENLLLTLAFSLDLPNLASGQHKIGLGLDVTG